MQLCNCILPQGLMVQTSGNFHYAATEAKSALGFFKCNRDEQRKGSKGKSA